VLGVLTGVACGAINGLLVTRLQLPSFIVTLGTLGIFLGIAQLMTGGTTVAGVPPAIQNEIGLRNLLGGTPLGPSFRLIPPMVIAFAIAVVAAIALNRTRFGRYTFAIGSNAAAARRAGIDVDRHLLKVYVVSGLLAGIAGTFDLMRFGTASVGTHQSDNLAAISAAVIGGTSLFGGLGSIGGSVIGAFIPVVLRNGLVITGVPSFWQNVAVGVVLIVAVWLDQRRRRAERADVKEERPGLRRLAPVQTDCYPAAAVSGTGTIPTTKREMTMAMGKNVTIGRRSVVVGGIGAASPSGSLGRRPPGRGRGRMVRFGWSSSRA
jgi:ribose transport system permease protein